MVSGILLVLGFGTRMSHPYVYVAFWAPITWPDDPAPPMVDGRSEAPAHLADLLRSQLLGQELPRKEHAGGPFLGVLVMKIILRAFSGILVFWDVF